MDNNSDVRHMLRQETDEEPNRFSAKALLFILVALFTVCILNEMQVFDVNRRMIWGCFLMTAGLCSIAQYLVRNERLNKCTATKYILMLEMLLLTLGVSVFLNISVTMLCLLPMFVATRYRSVKLSFIAVTASALCCILTPLLAWHYNTWTLKIMIGYLETTCRVSVTGLAGQAMTDGTAIGNILMYMVLPQLMLTLIFGAVTLGVTEDSIKGLLARVRVTELSENLGAELKRVEYMQSRVLYSIAEIVENRDYHTGGHIKRTSAIVRFITEEMRAEGEDITEEFCDAAAKAASLHDIGKIAIDDSILRKQFELTEEEREQIYRHSELGAEIIRKTLSGIEDEELIRVAENVALYHHEWYDGSGYPHGLRGDDIPLEARIMSVADVYDALISERSYKKAIPPDEVFDTIEGLMGKQFDPKLNKFFVAVREKIEAYYREIEQRQA